MTGLLRDDAGLLHPVLINVPANQIREIIEKAEDCRGSALNKQVRIELSPITRALNFGVSPV
jgi:hypothetical protein